jgi:modulator of FtsH protease HflK
MSDEHEHHDHAHPHLPSHSEVTDGAPLTPEDSGSQALAEALRSSFAIVKIVMALMVAAFFCSGFFQVGPSEKAVILRFGKPVGEGQKALLAAGLHWSLPYPIDEVVKIPITEIQKVTSNNGWYLTTPEAELSGEEMPAGASLNPAVDGYVITADRNIIHVRATAYYHIEDPIRYVFDFVAASNAVQNALDNALLYTAAHFKVDAALYDDQAGFQEAVQQRVTDLTVQQQLGIAIDRCTIDRIIPPRQLQSIFDQVTIAGENRNKALLDAHSHENQVLSEADSRASSITNEAESARVNYVESINADAKSFSALLPRYKENPSLFAQLQLVEVMGRALTNVGDIWLEPTAGGGTSIENRLQLNREPPEPKPAANP